MQVCALVSQRANAAPRCGQLPTCALITCDQRLARACRALTAKMMPTTMHAIAVFCFVRCAPIASATSMSIITPMGRAMGSAEKDMCTSLHDARFSPGDTRASSPIARAAPAAADPAGGAAC